MARLDAKLDSLLVRKSLYEQDPQEAANYVDPDRLIPVYVQFTGEPEPLHEVGFSPRDIYGQIAFGIVNVEVLERLSQLSSVVSIQEPSEDVIQLDDSIPEIKADDVWSRTGDNFSGYTGRGVIVGVIDTGIDFRHPNFIAADGETSRILQIWDQTLQPEGSESSPPAITGSFAATLGYGVVYSKDDIEDAIKLEAPPKPVRHIDKDGHGTHVAGIAAGDGSQDSRCHGAYTYTGVAPEADIIAVRLFGLTDGDRGEDQDPPADPPLSIPGSGVQDALRFIFEEARKASKPVVINCSFGRFTHRMDGSSAQAQDVNTLLTSNPQGRAVVWAAGNDGNADFHATGTVPGSSGTFELEFEIYGSDSKEREIAVVYSGSNLDVEVTSPVDGANGTVSWVSPGANGQSNTANGTIDGGTAGLVTVNNTQDLIYVTITPPKHPASDGGGNGHNVAGDDWKITLRNTAATPTQFDAFCIGGSSHDFRSPRFENHTSVDTTLTHQATGETTITVGSYKIDDQLAKSSGRGPTLDGRTKPELCAPGVDIMSAASVSSHEGHCHFCCCECCRSWYTGMGGTSMAAPHVTGAVALMLNKNPNLTHVQIKAQLAAEAGDAPTDAPPDDTTGWGAGRLDAKETVDALATVNAPEARVAAPEEPIETPLLERFLETAYGRAYYELVETYSREVFELINTNKRVATVWHRNRGPTWTRIAMSAFFNPELKIPLTVAGKDFRGCVDRFAAMLKRYASPALRTELDRCEPKLDLLREDMTILDLISVVGNEPLDA